MGKRDPRVDAYIDASADFAKPILAHVRDLVHAACPEVVETIKWNMPFFEYRGNLCHMAAFKAHCGFGFWKQKEVVGDQAVEGAMGSFGPLRKLSDLPSKKILAAYVVKAMVYNDSHAKAPRVKKPG